MRYKWLKPLSDRPLLIIFSLFLPWSIWFIYRTSFTVEDTRYFCLFDDAMISMVYAKNLVNGYGLNWARFGEPVEGFTTPLWTFLMIPINALPVGLNYKSLLVQILSLSLLAANLLMLRRLMIDHFGCGSKSYWFPSVALTASYYPLNHWALQGMESGLQAFIVTSSVYLALNIIEKRSSPIALFSLFGIAYLVRMDMLLLVLVVLGFIAYRRGITNSNRRSWLIGFGIFFAVVSAYSIFRWTYFHELLPNTYYLKLAGIPLEIRILRGFNGFLEMFLLPAAIPIFLILIAVIPLLRTNPKSILPLSIISVYSCYSIYVGGDVWEFTNVGANRFIVIVMPMLFLLFNAALNYGLNHFDQRKKWPSHRDAYVMIPLSLVCFFLFNGFFTSKWGLEREFMKHTAIMRPLNASAHAWLVPDTLKLNDGLEPGSVVVTGWGGIPAYFTDFRMVDAWGYSEKKIARMGIPLLPKEDFRKYYPGHMKKDVNYILTRYRPDFVLHSHGMPDDFWVRRGYEYDAELKGWRKRAMLSET